MTTALPRKTLRTEWAVGDALTVDLTRWIIRRLDPATGDVSLEAMNTTNHAEWWHTTVDRLPGRTA